MYGRGVKLLNHVNYLILSGCRICYDCFLLSSGMQLVSFSECFVFVRLMIDTRLQVLTVFWQAYCYTQPAVLIVL